MQLLKAKSNAIIIVTVLLMASAAMATLSAFAQDEAHGGAPQGQITGTVGSLPAGVTPSITITTDPYLSFTPNPIGLGQSLLVNLWMHPPINVQRSLGGLTVIITKPDGETVNVGPMNSYQGDTSAWFEWVVDQVGTWKLKFEFLGFYYPAGNYLNGIASAQPRTELGVSSVYLDSAYYKPSATPVLELVVQQDYVASWPPSPLPTDYWTRPVSPMNREWWSILGDYPGASILGGGPNWPAKTNVYMSNYEFVPYVQGPNSAHILWRRQGDIGGLLGGPSGQLSNTAGATFPAIVFAGRCYETYTKPGLNYTSQTYWRCYDLRTNELYWERPLYSGESAPTFVEYAAQGAEVPGALARAGKTVYLVALTNPSGTTAGRILKYNPYTGILSVNLTGRPTEIGAPTMYVYPYMLSIQNLGTSVPLAQRYRLINWTIENNAGQWRAAIGGGQLTIQNFTERLMSNISWPFSSLGTCDFEAMVAVQTGGISAAGTGVSIGQTITAASLLTGQVLWNVTTDLTTGYETFFSSGIGVADQGKYAGRMQNGQWYCWDLRSGNIVWKSELSAWPFGVFGAYDVQSAYGLLFANDYVGVTAINWTTGEAEWKFVAPTPYQFETPYQGQYPFHGSGKVADGKLYTFSVEHTPSQPITRGDRLYCLNATTGECIWNITQSQSIGGSRTFQGAIAEGYLAHTNTYDAYLYVYGKGKSATTVESAPATISKNSQVLIRGTVNDLSPAQPGTPCVAQDSMSTWMEYLHMQAPIDGVWHNATIQGVTVSLTAISSDGNVIDLGSVTTNGYYGTFSKAWTPPAEGTYEIVATFNGDDSYGSSGAATSVSVGPAPVTPDAPEPQIIPDYTWTIIGGVIAVIIAVAIFGVLILRKH